MAIPGTSSYTIAQAAALTGLHKNTIRLKVKSGQIPAEARPGKFGEEYRISRQALIDVGLLAPEAEQDTVAEGEVLARIESDINTEGTLQAALHDLFLHHESAMFRMGYLEAELERSKALAEHTQSVEQDRRSLEMEVFRLRQELERAQAHAAEIDEVRGMLADMEQETEQLRTELKEYREAEERRRAWQFWRR